MAINVGSAVAYLDLDTSKFSKGIAGALASLKSLADGTTSVGDKFKTVGGALSTVGGSLSKTVTLPIAAIGTAAVKTSSEFESSMSKVSAIMGDKLNGQFDELRNKAIEMGAKTKFSAVESAEAFTYMAMAGWDAQQAMDGIEGIMNLAAADGLDLATTSDIVTDALTAFGLQASDSSHFADVLAQAASSANTNVSLMGESFKYVGPVAGALGYSIEDVSTALGLMANAGVKGSTAGTSLRQALTSMIKPTDAAAIAMENLNIEIANEDGTMKSLQDVMDILRDRFSGLTQEQQASYASTLFGQRAMSGMLAIINASSEDYQRLTDSIASATDESTGYSRAQEMSEEMMNNLKGSITLLKSAVESLLVKLGTALTPTIKKIAESITKLVEKLNSLSDEQIQQIVKIAAIAAAIGPVLIIVGKVISAIGAIIKVLSLLKPVFAALSGPVGWIIAAIAALTAGFIYLWKNCEGFRNFFINLWETIKNFFMNLPENIKTAYNNIVSGISEFFSNIGEKFTEFIHVTIPEFIESVKEWFSNLPYNIGYAIGQAIGHILNFGERLWQWITEDLPEFFAGLGEKLKALPEKIATALKEGWEKLKEGTKKLLETAKTAMKNFIEAFVTKLKTLPDKFREWFNKVTEFIKNLPETLKEIGKNIINGMWEGLKSAWEAVEEWFRGIVDKVTSFIQGIKDGMASARGAASGTDGSHANGLDYVPYNGYVAELHQGERVLTKSEAKDYPKGSGGAGDTFIFNSPKAIDPYEASRLLKKTKMELEWG